MVDSFAGLSRGLILACCFAHNTGATKPQQCPYLTRLADRENQNPLTILAVSVQIEISPKFVGNQDL